MIWLALVAAMAVDPQTDPCFCDDAGGIWYASPDLDYRTAGDPPPGVIDVRDFLKLLEYWGPCTGCCHGDIDRDGMVGVSDFLLLIEAWGTAPHLFVHCRELP